MLLVGHAPGGARIWVRPRKTLGHWFGRKEIGGGWVDRRQFISRGNKRERRENEGEGGRKKRKKIKKKIF